VVDSMAVTLDAARTEVLPVENDHLYRLEG
jgi:hypothetical protein